MRGWIALKVVAYSVILWVYLYLISSPEHKAVGLYSQWVQARYECRIQNLWNVKNS